jgi:hypothetical protein
LLLNHKFRTLRLEIFEIRGLGFEFAATSTNKCVHSSSVNNASGVVAQLPSRLSFVSVRRKIIKLNGACACSESHVGSDGRPLDRYGAS